MSRGKDARIWLSSVTFVGIVAAIDYLLLDYLMSHGLEPKSQAVRIAGLEFSIPILSLTFVGVLIVATAAWINISSTMRVTTLREMSQLETARVLRAAGLALLLFSIVLFLPYIVGAGAFWAQMSSLSRSVPQLAGGLQGFLQTIEPIMKLDAVGKLAISQNAAAAVLVIVSGLIAHYQRRIRRTR